MDTDTYEIRLEPGEYTGATFRGGSGRSITVSSSTDNPDDVTIKEGLSFHGFTGGFTGVSDVTITGVTDVPGTQSPRAGLSFVGSTSVYGSRLKFEETDILDDHAEPLKAVEMYSSHGTFTDHPSLAKRETA